MASAPNCARTRESSSATRPSAVSHDTSTKRSTPRPVPSLRCRSLSQLSRTAGAATRRGECTMAGIASNIGEGCGSFAKGSQRTTRPSSTTAVKAPQWEREETRRAVIGMISRSFHGARARSCFRKGLPALGRDIQTVLGGKEQGMKSQSQDWSRPRREGTSPLRRYRRSAPQQHREAPARWRFAPSGPPRRCLPLATVLRRYLRSTSDRLPAPTRTRTLQSATLPGDLRPPLLVSQSPRRRNREFPFGGNVSSVDI